MKCKKGDYGYIRSQKLARFLKTILFFLLPLAVFTLGYVLNRGDRMNIYTVIAIVGCIPACMSAVGMIMMWMRHPMRRELYEEISSRAGSVEMAYELYVTTRDRSLFLDAVAICGEFVTAYADRDVSHADLAFLEEHIRKSLRADHCKATVKIFDRSQKKAFLERLDTFRERGEELDREAQERFRPDEKYAGLTRNQTVRRILLALSL
jgi:hypothetical protein